MDACQIMFDALKCIVLEQVFCYDTNIITIIIIIVKTEGPLLMTQTIYQ